MTGIVETVSVEDIELIYTQRLILNIITAEAAKHICTYGTEQAIRSIFGIDSEATYIRYKTKFSFGGNKYQSFRLFMIRDKDTNAFMGSCNFHIWMPEHSRAEIGYLINEQYRRQGIAKEAMRAVLEHGFEQMNLNRVEAFVSLANEPSLKLLNHYGFTQEGLLREHYCKNNIVEDSVCFSLLRREYDLVKDTW
jgi:ribosomal-protein-alanine N-acetyltransferase